MVKSKQESMQEKLRCMTCERQKDTQNPSVLNHRPHAGKTPQKCAEGEGGISAGACFVATGGPTWNRDLGNQPDGKSPNPWGSPCRREATLNPEMIPPLLLQQEQSVWVAV